MNAAHFAAMGIKLHPEKLGWRTLTIYPPVSACRRVLGDLHLKCSINKAARHNPFSRPNLSGDNTEYSSHQTKPIYSLNRRRVRQPPRRYFPLCRADPAADLSRPVKRFGGLRAQEAHFKQEKV